MFVGIDHLNLSVRSLESATRFYALFGFEVVEKGASADVPWRIVRSGDSMLCLYERPEEAGPGGSLGHVGFRLRDADSALFRAIEDAGGALRYAGESFRRPFSRSWYVEDPDGNEIELTAWDENTVRFPEMTPA